MKSTVLPSRHYAASWPTEGALVSTEEINEVGRRYAEATVEAEKQALQLEICRAFHPYLMKYLVMICRGHVPVVGVGKNRTHINPDVLAFVRYFLPKGQRLNQTTAGKVVRHFHLAHCRRQQVRSVLHREGRADRGGN